MSIDFVPPGDHRGKRINERQLHDELAQAGVALAGVGLLKDQKGAVVSLRVHLPGAPNQPTARKIADVLAAHVPAPETPPESIAHPRLEELRAKRRTGAALSAGEQQELLDLLLGV